MKIGNAVAMVVAAALTGTAMAGTYGWNTGSGIWDTSSANWSGSGTTWVDSTGNTAYFTNTATSTGIAIDGARTAGVVMVGAATSKANFSFTNGALTASSFRVFGSGDRSTGNSTPTLLSNVTVSVSGNISAGRWTMVIGGTSVVSAAGAIGGSLDGTDGTWGTLTIRDSAVVTAANGINAANQYWILNLNGGTLITKNILAADTTRYGGGQVIFNGAVVKPTQDNSDFVTLTGAVADGFSYSAQIGNGGAIFDTDGKNIGIKVNLKPYGSGGLTKLGAGTLALSGTNTYSGATGVSNGTLKVYAKALPSATSVAVAETGLVDLSGASNTVYGLSGKGAVSNGTLTVTGLIQPGGTNALGTLTVPGGTVLTGTLLADVEADNTNDVLAVQGSVNVSAATFALAPTATLNPSRAYTLLTCTGTPPHFASVSLPAGWTLRYVGGAIRLATSGSVTYNWSTNSGTWDTVSPNWSGAGPTWGDNGDAFFTNTAAFTTVTVDGTRTADAVTIGNATSFANYSFTGGTLALSSFRVQGWGDRLTGLSTPTAFSNVTVNASGNISVGRWTLVMGGNSVITAAGLVGGTWGTLIIRDNAFVTATGGMSANADAHWLFYLNGGTFVTKNIVAADTTFYDSAQLRFNGTVVKPTQDTSNFITLIGSIGEGFSSSTLVDNGGAIFDTDGKNIGINVGLKAVGTGGLTKRGAGTLTLTVTNHSYIGATTIEGGCLTVSGENAITGSVPIVNASFETYDGPALIPDGTANAYRFAPTGAGWIFTGGGGIATSNSNFMIQNPKSDGACAAMLNGVASLSQTVTVSVAGLYDLSFMALKGRTNTFNTLAVKIDGNSVFNFWTGMLADNAFRTIEAKGLSLTAGPHVLLFQTYDAATTNSTVIDRVSLMSAAGGSLPSGTAVNITAAGAAYIQSRTSQTIGSLDGVSGSIVSNSGILTAGGNNTNTTFAGVISGPGSLVKTGTGMLTLGGANTYTGATTVVSGTLEITASDTLPATATLALATGATLKLSNANEQTVSTLFINGVQKYRGTWGAAGSGASMTRTQFSGTGVLRVLNGPACPGTFISVK